MNLKDKIKDIVNSNGFHDKISEILIKDTGAVGEGFTSLTQLVTVNFENSEIKPLNWFIKIHTESDDHMKLIVEMKAFEKEARFLVDYVQAAQKMCQQKGKENFIDFYPKCYYGDENLIVMENLVLEKGYKTISMDIRHNLEAAKFAIITMAKHHAIGYVMIKDCGGADKFFEKFPNLDYESYNKPMFGSMMEPYFDTCINANVKMLEKSGIPGANHVAEKYKNYLGKGNGIVMGDISQKGDEKLLVFSHGDYWTNNMMYLLEDKTNKILHHMVIDFQITRYNSSALELGYYLFTSLQPKVRKNHLKELLELYTSTLNAVTEEFDHPANLDFERVFLEFRRKIGHGFWLGFTIAVGPVMSTYKKVDMTKVDVKDWSKVLAEYTDKWIADNPEKLVEIAEELVQVIEEYETLVLNE